MKVLKLSVIYQASRKRPVAMNPVKMTVRRVMIIVLQRNKVKSYQASIKREKVLKTLMKIVGKVMTIV